MDATVTATHATVEHQPAAPDSVRIEASPSELEQDLLVEDVSIDGMCGVY